MPTIDIGTLTLDPGNYRVHVTLNGSIVALAINVATDLTLTHTDQFVLDQATGATGNLLTNDAEGSSATQLQIQNDADLYVGGPVTVQGTYGALTVQADGSYTYVPNPAVAYFDTPQVDSFNYQLVHPNGQVSQAALDVTVEPSGAGVAGFAGFSLMSFGFGDDTIPLGDFPTEPDAFFSTETLDLGGIVEPRRLMRPPRSMPCSTSSSTPRIRTRRPTAARASCPTPRHRPSRWRIRWAISHPCRSTISTCNIQRWSSAREPGVPEVLIGTTRPRYWPAILRASALPCLRRLLAFRLRPHAGHGAATRRTTGSRRAARCALNHRDCLRTRQSGRLSWPRGGGAPRRRLAPLDR